MADVIPEAAEEMTFLLLVIELEMSGAPTTTCNIVQLNIMIGILEIWLTKKNFNIVK